MSKIHVLPSVRIWLTRSWSRQEGKIMKKLNEIPVGQTVVVKKITGEGPVKRRIMDLSLIHISEPTRRS